MKLGRLAAAACAGVLAASALTGRAHAASGPPLPPSLDAAEMVQTAKVGDLMAGVEWDGVGVLSSFAEPTGHLILVGEGLRLAKKLTDLPLGARLAVSFTQTAGNGQSTKPIPVSTALTVVAPPPGPLIDVSSLTTRDPPLLAEYFKDIVGKIDLYKPTVKCDYATPNRGANTGAKWFGFYAQVQPKNTPDPPSIAYLNKQFCNGGGYGGARGLPYETELFGDPDANGLPLSYKELQGGGVKYIASELTPSTAPNAAKLIAEGYNANSFALEWSQPIPGTACTEVRFLPKATPGGWPIPVWKYMRGSFAKGQERDIELGWKAPAPTFDTGFTTFAHPSTDGDPDLIAQKAPPYVLYPLTKAYHTADICDSLDQEAILMDGVTVQTIAMPASWKGKPWTLDSSLAIGTTHQGIVAPDLSQFPTWLKIDRLMVWRAPAHWATPVPPSAAQAASARH